MEAAYKISRHPSRTIISAFSPMQRLYSIFLSPANVSARLILTAVLYRQQDYKQLTDVLLKMPSTCGLAPEMDNGGRNALLFKAYTVLGDEQNALKWYMEN